MHVWNHPATRLCEDGMVSECIAHTSTNLYIRYFKLRNLRFKLCSRITVGSLHNETPVLITIDIIDKRYNLHIYSVLAPLQCCL